MSCTGTERRKYPRGVITHQKPPATEVPGRHRRVVDRQVQRTVSELVEDTGGPPRCGEGERLTRIDADHAAANSGNHDATSEGARHIRGDAEHRKSRAAVEIITAGSVEINGEETQLAVVRDGEHAVGDDHGGEVVRGRQDQGTGTDFLQAAIARPTERSLGERAAFGDVEIASGDEIKGLGQGEILLPRAERGAVELDLRIGAEIRRAVDDEVTRLNHGDTGVGVRTREAQGAGTGLVQAVVAAGAVGDHATESDDGAVLLRIRRRVDGDGAQRAADGVVGETDGAREREVGRLAVEDRVKVDVT